MKKSLRTVLTFARLNAKRFFRDRLAIFFTVIFPMVFLLIFGLMYKNNSSISFKVALINESNSSYAQSFVDQTAQNKLFKIDKNITSLDSAQEKMMRGELDATLVLPPDFGEVKNEVPGGQLTVYYNENSAQAAQTLASVLQEQFKAINAQFVSTEMPFTVVTASTNQSGSQPFDYAFAGLLGFSIIGLGIFGPVNVFPELKKQGILRRLHTTPIRVWQYFLSNVLSQILIGLIAIAILFTFAVLVFDLHMAGNYLTFAAFTLLGIFTIYGIGLAVGGWAKNERQAAPLANLVVFPMMFLSGTFFPRFLMPDWIQHISGYLPLTPVIDGIRLIVTEGKGLLEIGPQLGLVAIWAVVIYVIAFRIFRWE
jgi:ABC-2 type transport system permease protein